MKIVLLCGHQYNQVALANKIAQQFHLAGIIIEQKETKNATAFSLKQLIEKVLNRTVFITLHRSWFKLLDTYKNEYPAFPETEKIRVSNINSEASVDFIRHLQPDLVMVSGTSIVKNKILDLRIPKGIINLHTGLSPYINGGPNCTNWCIAEKQFHLIGSTIMWIDAGIDSGDIITTERTLLDGKESLPDLHLKVMNHAHTLYLKALKKLQEDPEHCAKVKQKSIAAGTTYYNSQWNSNAKWRLLKNLKKLRAYFKSAQYKIDISKIKTVPL